MRKFRRLPEASVANIEQLRDRVDLRIHDAQVKLRARSGECLGFRNCLRKGIRRARQILAFLFVSIGHRQQHAAKTRPAHLVLRRKIRAAKKRLPVGHQESCKRPPALSAERADRGLVAGIHVRPLVAIHFHRHKMFV